MKNLRLLSLATLCIVFACETDTDIVAESAEQTFYTYNTNQQFSTIESFVIDFEDYNTGDIVSEIYIMDPFENAQVAGITMAFPNSNAAMIFDSSNPTGGDFDIGTPNEIYGGPGIGNGGASNDTALGNVLILSEDLDASDPDDIFEIGASFVFDFSANANVTLNTFDILDIEESSNPTIVTLYDIEENVLLSKGVTPGGDNSKTTVDLENTSDVAFMEIIMNSSGAIDNIALEMETEEACVECDSSIVELTFMYNGFTQQAPIRIETSEGEIIFESILQLNEEFTVTGNALDGTFGSEIVIFIENEQVAVLATDCSQIIGPGYYIQGLILVSGTTQTGSQLCPVEISIG
ncbi:hypothetical protein [uncultured Winogradskyella sp.]|uniref:hypothetical protein n=1 Tax=uncultured Winogradskyella sp. TaxID=395353 RepID=UPI002619B3CA|nr:hypothetical protein [uncultured Winogradskyella sp.]